MELNINRVLLNIFILYDCSRYRFRGKASRKHHARRYIFTEKVQVHLASIIPDSVVVEDGAKHLSAFSRFLSAPLGNERAVAFSTELLQTM